MVKKAMVCCKFCYEDYDLSVDDVDRNELGFWCDHCDGYTYFGAKEESQRKFTLILESKHQMNQVPSSSNNTKLNKRLSPLRYPGGKSKIANYIFSLLSSGRTELFCSPYTGGGSVEFALLYAGKIKYLVLNDYDFGVYSLFELIRTFPDSLMLDMLH